METSKKCPICGAPICVDENGHYFCAECELDALRDEYLYAEDYDCYDYEEEKE